MGNVCIPRKIIFSKVSSNVLDEEVYDKNFLKSLAEDVTEKCFHICEDSDGRICSPENKSVSYKIRNGIRLSLLETISNLSIHIPRSGSNNLSLNENSSGASYNSSESLVIRNDSRDTQSILDQKDNLKITFIQLCFTKQNHSDIEVAQISQIVEEASRINFAKIIDYRNCDNNTIVSVAIMENNVLLLRTLIRFIPDFPEFITINNQSIPLVEVAATKIFDNSENENMLSIIFKKWIKDYSYHKIALRNIVAKNSNFETIFEYLIRLIPRSNTRETHFISLEYLFQLYKILQLKNILNVQDHRVILTICDIIQLEQIFWTTERRNYLCSMTHCTGNCYNLVIYIYEETNRNSETIK